MKKRDLHRVLGAALFSLAAGLAAGAVLQFGFGTFDGNCWATAGVLALGIAGTSLFVLGLEALVGARPGARRRADPVRVQPVVRYRHGLAVAAVGQYMPIGAGIAYSVWVLLAWIAVGVLLVGAAAVRNRRTA
ncbi:hypothetical protein [Corynebacterium kalidii]|uniref:Uncharacterized protein n=1 Tax=Corynebacterium kalidii TaxID=2931982 RepID=A0A9X1WHE2_9CORY|nr:hypothetical protein [Corynebacterium kalidii]MCJ7857662.1 hypothetical protein [Corynebacterium kalidii]